MNHPANLVKLGKKFNRIIEYSMEKGSRKTIEDDLANVIDMSLKNQVFSACSVGYFKLQGKNLYRKIHHFGRTDLREGARVDEATMYDLASLTKPLVTTLAIMALVAEGKVRIEDKIGRYFRDIEGKKGEISLSLLLSHSSGWPAHRPFYKVLANYPQPKRKDMIIRLIGEERLLFQPGCDTVYSDLGFILLGRLVEKVTSRSLADFWREEIAQPLGLQNQLFFPGPEGLSSETCAVTGVCGWSGKKLCGLVHDENCRMLGGVAGHAGLFGTASGVLSLVENLLLQYLGVTGHPAYPSSILRKFLTKRSESNWTFGFDTPSPGISSSGRYFSPMTVGHLGFTGTSFWLDLAKGLAVVLLTNRVLMGNDLEAVRKFRPIVHDTIMKNLTTAEDPIERHPFNRVIPQGGEER